MSSTTPQVTRNTAVGHQPGGFARIDMAARQRPLQMRYTRAPAEAMIRDRATTRSRDVHPAMPLYGEVSLGHDDTNRLTYGVHVAVGGESDEPVPGEMLSAALACCLDSTLRILANRFGIALDSLEVQVDAVVDVRGTLQVDREVPVGFQAMEVNVRVGTAGLVEHHVIERLLRAAEQACVVLQTLRGGPAITVRCEVDGAPLAARPA